MIVASVTAEAVGPGGFSLSSSTVDGGGGSSSGGPFILRGTIAQPDAGATMSGGTFALAGGFWTGTQPACPADVTGNGSVNVQDLLAVISAWGVCPGQCPPYCAADVSHDCTVNIQDLLAVIAAWGACPL
jgi:hypothetical protein